MAHHVEVLATNFIISEEKIAPRVIDSCKNKVPSDKPPLHHSWHKLETCLSDSLIIAICQLLVI
ncbi:hypothetical protein J6590_044495 [Homalodisca vitripennis]|nr:hypothetical protein J6590_044495 [Homalodisca vitripennis]